MSNIPVDITPEKFKCGDSSVCTVVFKLHKYDKSNSTKNERCIIIGKIVSVTEYPILAGKIGIDEIAIEVPFDLVKQAIISE
jgi:hypothetical protein